MVRICIRVSLRVGLILGELLRLWECLWVDLNHTFSEGRRGVPGGPGFYYADDMLILRAGRRLGREPEGARLLALWALRVEEHRGM